MKQISTLLIAALLAASSAACAKKDVHVIASEQFDPCMVVADETHLYWVNSGTGTIQSLPKGRPDEKPIVLLKLNRPSGIAVEGANLYWADAGLSRKNADGQIGRVSKRGGPRLVMASLQAFPSGIAADSTSIYWTNAGADDSSPAGRRGSLMKMALEGGPPIVLASKLDLPADPVVSGDRIYFRTIDSIVEMPTDGGSGEVIISKMRPRRLKMMKSGSSRALIWVNASTDALLSDGSIDVTTVGDPDHRTRHLVSGVALVDGLAVGDDRVYWAASSGEVFRVAGGGGQVEKISADLGHVSDIEVDGDDLVVADRNSSDDADGRVLRLKR